MERTRGEKMTNDDDRTSSLPDRISSLPDDVLCYILSFLPTKYSVRTRILSTRWKYLYAFVPVLDFDCTADDMCIAKRVRFREFVTRVLMTYNISQMTKFRLNCDFRFSIRPDHFLSWILFVMCLNVQEVDIAARFSEPQTLPSELFSSKLLSVLKLEGDFYLEFPSAAFLPCLKTLHLQSIFFDDSARSIVMICPILENLRLYACDLTNVEVLNISHSTLRDLCIEECIGHELVLNAASLISFVYVNSIIYGICGELVLNSLDKSCLWIAEDCIPCVTDIYMLVTAFSHVRHLSLSQFVIEVFECCRQSLPIFHKLAILEVGEVSKIVLGILPDLLKRCQLLKVLLFTRGCSSEEVNDTDMIGYGNVPSCVLTCLKVVEFKKFRKQNIEYKLVKFFLKNARILENMNIVTNWRSIYYEFNEEVLTLARFSRDCHIQFDLDDETRSL